MLRRSAVLHALGAARASGERHRAALALKGLDPIIAWFARRQLLTSLKVAHLRTSIDSERHVLAVAGLIAARQVPEHGYENEDEVATAFAQLLNEYPTPRRGPWLSLSLLLLGAAGVTVWLVVAQLTAPFDPRSLPAGQTLGPELTEYLVDASRLDPASSAERQHSYLAAAKGNLSADTLAALRTLLGRVAALRQLPLNSEESRLEEALNQFSLSAVQLEAGLAKEGAPFFVDVDWRQSRSGVVPYVLSFYVERERRLRAGTKEHRVVHLWRLDSLAVHQGYLGYTRPHTPAALVLLDQVETDLIGDVLPALPPGEAMELVDFQTRHRGRDWINPLEEITAQAVKRHFALLPAAEQARYQKVGRLLAQRRTLVRKWQAAMQGLGAELVVPRRLIPEADYLGDLEHRVPRAELRDWKALHEQLLEESYQTAFLELRDNYVAAVERHEVQHRIDYEQELFEVPAVLVRRLNVSNPLGVDPRSLPGRARDELSAYLASVATASPSPLLELALIARFLFNKGAKQGPYGYAALGVFDALSEELELDVAARRRTVVGPAQLAELVQTVLRQDANQLRAAAHSAYKKQFGVEVAQVELRTEHSNQRWRH